VNFGYVCIQIRGGANVIDLQSAIESVAAQVGWVLLVLGVMHFFNIYIFNRLRRRSANQLPTPPAHTPMSHAASHLPGAQAFPKAG
jgi:hypothetical protein